MRPNNARRVSSVMTGPCASPRAGDRACRATARSDDHPPRGRWYLRTTSHAYRELRATGGEGRPRAPPRDLRRRLAPGFGAARGAEAHELVAAVAERALAGLAAAAQGDRRAARVDRVAVLVLEPDR